MIRFVLDASVVVKWFHEEEYTSEALMLREAHNRGLCKFIVPILIVYEVSNALKKPPNLFNEREVGDAVESVFSRLTEIVAPDQTSMRTAIEAAFKYEITMYDASYVALAENEKIMMVTGDEWLSTRVKNEEIVLFLGSRRYKELIREVMKQDHK